MRVLHVSKTSDGGRWAALQVRELVRSGIEVDVALPSLQGGSMDLWNTTGARLHAVDLSFPASRPWLARVVIRDTRRLVDRVRPDVIHSHFVATTLTLRAALGRNASVPRLFQVPGPLHLEHRFYRMGEIASAGSSDYWIASSRCTRGHYLRAGIPDRRVFLSYYGVEQNATTSAVPAGLRARLAIPPDALVVGNINMFYGPKRHLGQRTGLKAHEDVLEALRIVMSGTREYLRNSCGRPVGKRAKIFRGSAHAS